MYGSDFFYPIPSDQHEYDNLTYPEAFSRPPISSDCPHCHRTMNRLSLHDISCQVPSETDDDNGNQQHIDQTRSCDRRLLKRSSPLYTSPRSSPSPFQLPVARSLLAPYHVRQPHSRSSSVTLQSRSRSAPSASSSTPSPRSSRTDHSAARKASRLLPSLSPLDTASTLPTSLAPETVSIASTTSTTTLLRSIKTSIHAMRKRLKDIRRLSEVGTCCRCYWWRQREKANMCIKAWITERKRQRERERVEEKITSVAWLVCLYAQTLASLLNHSTLQK